MARRKTFTCRAASWLCSVVWTSIKTSGHTEICLSLSVQILEEVERRREISPALVYPFMRSVMEAPFPAPGRTVTIKSFLPGSGNEVTLKPKEEMLIGSFVPPYHSFLQTQNDSEWEVICLNNRNSYFSSKGFMLGYIYIWIYLKSLFLLNVQVSGTHPTVV